MHRHSEDSEALESLADLLEGQEVSGGTECRIFVTGKGGVGKTFLTASLAILFARDGFRVLAVDADPQQNLAYTLGASLEEAESIVPLAACADYIEEKTGARPGSGYGGMLVLNPDARDVVERFSIEIGNVRLLTMGSVRQASSGCLCPENAMLHATVHALALRRDEVILMDTQGGLEHYGRALTEGFGQGVIVTEPTFNSLSIAKRCSALSRELGVRHLHLVVNKARPDEWGRSLRLPIECKENFESVITVPYDERIATDECALPSLLEEDSSISRCVSKLYLALRRNIDD